MDDLVKRADEVLKDVTPGPWEAVFDRQTWGWLEVDGPSFNVSAPTRATDLSLADAVQRKKDARFIAAARELVPAMRDRIEADAKRIERGVNAELLDQQQAMRERIAELEGKYTSTARLYAETCEREAIADRRADAAEAKLARMVEALETLRPVWAQGWSSDSMAAQSSAAALGQLWALLRASDQTEAVSKLRAALEGEKP